MSQEKARQRAQLWLRQAQDDFQAASMLHQGGQAAQACFLAQQVGEKALKALLAAEDRDLRSHSLTIQPPASASTMPGTDRRASQPARAASAG